MKVTKLINILGVDFKRFSIVGWKHEESLKFHFARDKSGLHIMMGRYDFELYFNSKGGE